MTDFWKIYNINTSNFDRYFVGADHMAKRLAELANTAMTGTFPPYNIKKVEDNKYVIEMAVAGFSKQDIELTLEENTLLIKGNLAANTTAEDSTAYVYKGIADRAFTRKFTLADNVEIQNAELLNGMLKVWLEHIIPESKKPKKININDASEDSKAGKNKKFLQE
jgi:molecular chaperone IbpA